MTAPRDILDQVRDQIKETRKFFKMSLPPMTHGSMTGYLQKVDLLISDITNLMFQVQLILGDTRSKAARLNKQLAIDAWDQYGKSRYYAEAEVNGDNTLTDLKHSISRMEAGLSLLDTHGWLVRNIRQSSLTLLRKPRIDLACPTGGDFIR